MCYLFNKFLGLICQYFYTPLTMTKCWLYSLCCIIYLVAHLFSTQQFVPLNPYCYLAPCLFLTANHQCALCICGSVSYLLQSLVCFIFQISHISNIIQYLSLSDYFTKGNGVQVHPYCCKWQNKNFSILNSDITKLSSEIFVYVGGIS